MDTNEQPGEEVPKAGYLEGYHLQKLLFPWSWGVRHVTLFSYESRNQTE